MSDTCRTLMWWYRRRATRVPLYWMANAPRWESLRRLILAERGLTEEDVDDPRMPF